MLWLGLVVLEQHKSMLVQGPERVLRMRALVFLPICVAVLLDALVTTWVAVAVAIRFADLLEVFVSDCASGCLVGAVFSAFLVMTGLASRLATFDFAGCLVDLLEITTVLLVDRALALLPRRRSPTKVDRATGVMLMLAAVLVAARVMSWSLQWPPLRIEPAHGPLRVWVRLMKVAAELTLPVSMTTFWTDALQSGQTLDAPLLL